MSHNCVCIVLEIIKWPLSSSSTTRRFIAEIYFEIVQNFANYCSSRLIKMYFVQLVLRLAICTCEFPKLFLSFLFRPSGIRFASRASCDKFSVLCLWISKNFVYLGEMKQSSSPATYRQPSSKLAHRLLVVHFLFCINEFVVLQSSKHYSDFSFSSTSTRRFAAAIRHILHQCCLNIGVGCVRVCCTIFMRFLSTLQIVLVQYTRWNYIFVDKFLSVHWSFVDRDCDISIFPIVPAWCETLSG